MKKPTLVRTHPARHLTTSTRPPSPPTGWSRWCAVTAGEEYPTGEVLLGNLPKVLRALCDHVLTGQATALDVAYRIAPLIDAIEGRPA